MTIVEARCTITGGVDTHLDIHVAATLDDIGGLLGVESFPASASGYRQLLAWMRSFGAVGKVGVEGTGAYGAGLARHLHAAGIEVIEVDRANRQARRQAGKSDPADAIEAARAALSGRARGLAKTRDGNVEAIRALLVARRSARNMRIRTLVQMRHLVFTAPDQLRDRLKQLSPVMLPRESAALRPRAGNDTVSYATKVSLQILGRRVLALEDELTHLDGLVTELVRATAPKLVAIYGVGIHTAAAMLVAAGDNPDRLRSEAAWAHLCGVAPIEASSGKGQRRRAEPPTAPPCLRFRLKSNLACIANRRSGWASLQRCISAVMESPSHSLDGGGGAFGLLRRAGNRQREVRAVPQGSNSTSPTVGGAVSWWHDKEHDR